MNILLLCSSRFALPSMRDLVYAKQLAAVVIPSFHKEFLEEVLQLLKPLGIPVITVDKKSNEAELVKAIAKYKIDIAFMMTYSYKIPAAVFNLPPKGFFNFHPGPLPAYRGSDPIFRQIKNREKLAGVTVHKVDAGYDTGPVVTKEMIRLDATDTYGILNNKLAELSARLCGLLLRMAGFDFAIPVKPQDETQAVFHERQTSKDIVINWEKMEAADIVALVNACNPWNKGAVSVFNQKIIRLLDVEAVEEAVDETILPGTVISIDPSFILVAAARGSSVRVRYIFTDEGFLKAGLLVNLGITAGKRFG